MIIEEEMIYLGQRYKLHYEDDNSFDDLPYNQCRQVYGVCFCGDKLVIGWGGRKQSWGLLGGTIEKGENYIDTLRREIREEANMEVLLARPIGWQKVILSDSNFIYQLRYACRVKPYGVFRGDPAGRIEKIVLIEPDDYKAYFDWGRIGAHLIARGRELILLQPTN